MSADELPVLRCWRCGAVCNVDWVEVTQFGSWEIEFVQGSTRCSDDQCAGWSDQCADRAPSPQEIQRKADKVTDRFWQRMWTA